MRNEVRLPTPAGRGAVTPAATPEALVDGDHDMPSEAEIEAMREEAESFRLPAPPPTPVRGRFYLTECEYCGWVGSSEHCGGNCGPDDDDIVCPVCCSSICGDEPDEADTAKHGEAVYQRIIAAEAARDAALADLQRVTAERDEARAKQAVPLTEEQLEARRNRAHGVIVRRLQSERDTATAEAASLRAEVEAKDRARWRPIATAPTDRPVVVRMRTDRLQGGWFVATVALPDPDDDSRFGSCSTIWHYNGDTLMTQFRGTWTDWLDDGGSDRTALARAATAGEGRSDG